MVGKQAKLALGLGALVLILGSGAYSYLRTAVQDARGGGESGSSGAAAAPAAAPAASTAPATAPGVAGGTADGRVDTEATPPTAGAPPPAIVINVGGPSPAPPAAERAAPGPTGSFAAADASAAYDNFEQNRFLNSLSGPTPNPRGPERGPGRSRSTEITNRVQAPSTLGTSQRFFHSITPGSRGTGPAVVRPTPQYTGALRTTSDRRTALETGGERRERVQAAIAAGARPIDAVRGPRDRLSTRRGRQGGGRAGDARGQAVIASGDLQAIRALAAERLAADLARTPNLTTGRGPRRPQGPQGSAAQTRAERLAAEAERARGVFDSRAITRF